MTIRIPAPRQTAHGTYPIVTRLLGAASWRSRSRPSRC